MVQQSIANMIIKPNQLCKIHQADHKIKLEKVEKQIKHKNQLQL
jgi:hypothetical protein